MAYSEGELEELKLKIGAAVTSGRLTKWQTTFLVDINSRIDKYGVRVRLSDKQLAKLNEILSAPAPRQHYRGPSKVVPYAQPQRRSAYRPYRRRGWFGRRIGYQLIAFAVVAAMALVASVFDKGMQSFSGSA